MISETVSYGLVMLVENTIVLVLLFDLIRRVVRKIKRVNHPHVTWDSGVILLAYLLCVTAFNISASYTCYVNYLVNDASINTTTVTARVFERTMILAAKSLLWYYSVKGDKVLFKGKV